MDRDSFIAVGTVVRSVLLAGLLAVGVVAPAIADETLVNVTGVTIDRAAYIFGKDAPSIRVTGTLTCDATGPAEYTEIRATQRGVSGQTNLDLLDFACTTEPRAFTAVVESFCDPGSCFRRGAARVQAVAPTLSVEQLVAVRPER
jgi:hypothetical protein